jgi:hypothetical protein
VSDEYIDDDFGASSNGSEKGKATAKTSEASI